MLRTISVLNQRIADVNVINLINAIFLTKAHVPDRTLFLTLVGGVTDQKPRYHRMIGNA